MKVIIPVIDNVNQKNVIASGFNVTSFVCIYNLETNQFTWSQWREIIPEGTKMTQKLKELSIFSVITKNIHFMALAIFKENGMQVYKSQGENLIENISFFNEKILEPYTVQEVENSSLCGGACSSCSTSSCEDKK
jgi:predicted Fe-Mo cluster-binding NifX family protein